jgi:hypothetical protein
LNKIKYYIHGITLAVACPIILYGHAIPKTEFPPASVIQPALISLVFYGLVCGAAFLLLRNASASALIGSIVILGVLYQWPIFVLIISATLAGCLILFFIKKRVGFQVVHLMLTAISVTVVGFFLVQFIGYAITIPWGTYHQMTMQMADGLEIPSNPVQKPDVYYIILDGYARADVLKSLYGYDNSDFIAGLEKRGFYVASQSRSNYPRTLLSLTSSLNIQYLDPLSERMGGSSAEWPVRDILQHSLVRSIFEKNGYRTIDFADEWDFSDIRDGDVYVKPSVIFPTSFERALISRTNLQTILRIFPASFISLDDYASHRRVILNDFSELVDIASQAGPKFTYVHIIAPHPPFVYNESGAAVDPGYGFTFYDTQNLFGGIENYEKGYLAQLSFVNQETLNTIDGILANSKTPPVIIIQADHGPAIMHYYFSIEELSTFERYSILNAYHLPGVDQADIPADITPVNSFRLVFNQYFGTDYEMLPNHQYFPSEMVLYQFQDVTNKTP